jgi:hypothetical protein
LPWKADLIADWFWDDQMRLRKTLISIDVHGTQFGIRKVWMLSEGATGEVSSLIFSPM